MCNDRRYCAATTALLAAYASLSAIWWTESGSAKFTRYAVAGHSSFFLLYHAHVLTHLLCWTFFLLLLSSRLRESFFAFGYLLTHLTMIAITPWQTRQYRVIQRGHPGLLGSVDRWSCLFQLVVGYVLWTIYLLFFLLLCAASCFFARQRRLRAREAEEVVLAKKREVLQLCEDLEKVKLKALTAEEAARVRVCPICLTEENIAYKRLPCGHVMHSKCVLEWFLQEQENERTLICPYCRRPVREAI